MSKTTPQDAALSKVVQRLIGAAERVSARALDRAEALTHQLDKTWQAQELERVEAYIKNLEPGPGYILTEDGAREMARAKSYRDSKRRALNSQMQPYLQRAEETRVQVGDVERTLKRLPRLEAEREQLRSLLAALEPLQAYIYALDRKAMEAAAAHLQQLEAAALLPPVQEEAPSEPENLDLFLPLPADLEFAVDDQAVLARLAQGKFDPIEDYQLNPTAQHLSLVGGFDVLLCLPLLRGVEHYPFQINTARQVLRTMRGRALLCDEVGLGKTIEAGLILKEYLERGLARKVLVLAPPALVSQWREEMQDKFGINFVTYEDPAFRALGVEAWAQTDRVIASLHTAKNPFNSTAIHQVDYDVVIVDEAHHLKNRTTVNWKFVNGLKSKYILLLTATPVQNNLDELFNLITLLSPGQLKTSSAFHREFVARGDARKPKNRTKLRELLMDVMVRNTRSQVSVVLPLAGLPHCGCLSLHRNESSMTPPPSLCAGSTMAGAPKDLLPRRCKPRLAAARRPFAPPWNPCGSAIQRRTPRWTNCWTYPPVSTVPPRQKPY